MEGHEGAKWNGMTWHEMRRTGIAWHEIKSNQNYMNWYRRINAWMKMNCMTWKLHEINWHEITWQGHEVKWDKFTWTKQDMKLNEIAWHESDWMIG